MSNLAENIPFALEDGARFLASLQAATVVIGIIATTMSFALAVAFFKNRTSIGTAFAVMLSAECVGLGITVVFSLSLFGVFDVMTEGVALVSRLIIFFTAMTSSLHLAFRLWTVKERRDP